ncbi:tyrosine decarboxylase MfnA [Methanoplanus sp. FWC-SCC4]|uniref:Probable L-tyrosine/L-aspartate decarboxylase n=1 Tax=Methanochimaera problematica TaxID=2609417 RepID=A0AA97FDI2_9EURY|nr:tyrosine decarboxylase MfnA [Methanoplanus sp. FWC-SCC4]WOF16872.1 tyrosine decarboxylase MfnA [Methanoplanus sp. FWC-SCC4]
MHKKGCSEEELFSFLSSVKENDRAYNKVLSSMCTIPHPVAVRAHNMFIETNLGDPGLFMGTASIEEMLVERLGTLLHHKKACGYSTSGGTESNIQALRIARKLGNSKCPNVVVPESAHFSFDKAADILAMEIRTVPSDDKFRMDAEKIEEKIDKNTVCLVGVAGTTEYGVVDPIEALSDIASDRDIFLHVDAAFGGLVLPFVPHTSKFDFELAGVSSLSVDPHKMGMSTIPAGCLLVRDPSYFHSTEVDTPYLTVQKECTLCGTRPGASVAGALAVLDFLGEEGMAKIVDSCMENTRRIIKGMENAGYPVATMPEVNVASFCCDETPKGWQVSRTRLGHMRTVCMPHVTKDTIDEFLTAIGEM